jgi:hypothetical protein
LESFGGKDMNPFTPISFNQNQQGQGDQFGPMIISAIAARTKIIRIC